MSDRRQADHDLALAVAREAAALVKKHHDGGVERLTKSHASTTGEAVTVADRAAQALIVERLRTACPEDGIIGEESADGSDITVDVSDPNGRNWVIDPIDGTNNFIAGLGNFAVCIGLLEAGEPTVGVVYDVSRDIAYHGAVGLGCFANGKPTAVKDRPLSKASVLMMTSNLIGADNAAPAWAAAFIEQTDLKVRILGTAALEAAMVAAGIADGAITVNGKLWDAVAPCALVHAAGGVTTDLRGRPRFPYDLSNYRGAKVPFLATTPLAKDELLGHLNQE